MEKTLLNYKQRIADLAKEKEKKEDTRTSEQKETDDRIQKIKKKLKI
jgi:hypothetical protein